VVTVFGPADPETWVRQPLPALGGISFLEAWERPDGEGLVQNYIAKARNFQESLADHPDAAIVSAASIGPTRASSYSCGVMTWDWGPTIPVYAVPPLARVRIRGSRVDVTGNLPAFVAVAVAAFLAGLLWVGMYGYIVAGVSVLGYFVVPRRHYQIADLRVRRGRVWLGMRGLSFETHGGTLRAGLWGWNTEHVAQALSERGLKPEGDPSA
jgi:hypothetical protein